MQTSELYRRGIVLPLTDEAESALRQNNVTETTDVECLDLATDKYFYMVWPVFQQVNHLCETIFDDYEETLVEGDTINCMIQAIKSYRLERDAEKEQDESAFLEKLEAMLQRAIALKKPVVAVF